VTANFDQVAAANGDGFEYYAKIKRTVSSTNVTVVSARQQIESHDLIPLQGKEVTLSWVAKAGANFSAASSAMLIHVYYGTTADQASVNPGGWAGFAYTLQTTQVITTSFVKYSTTFTVNANAKEMQIQLGFTPVGTAGAADEMYISNVQLEEGGIATDFEYLPYEQSLALCQRYYQLWNGGWYGVSAGAGHNQSTALPWNTTMRVTPTIARTGGTTSTRYPSTAWGSLYATTTGAVMYVKAVSSGGNDGWQATGTASSEL
jgi:hypothetical protein